MNDQRTQAASDLLREIEQHQLRLAAFGEVLRARTRRMQLMLVAVVVLLLCSLALQFAGSGSHARLATVLSLVAGVIGLSVFALGRFWARRDAVELGAAERECS